MSDNRPYIYAHEEDGNWSIIRKDGDQETVVASNLTREQAIAYLRDNR